MNKKIIIGIGIIFLGVLLTISKIIIPNTSGHKELELTYKSETSYKWEYEIEDESIVELARTKDITSEEDRKSGEIIYVNYIFRGLKQGKTTVTFKYINTENGSIEKERKLTIKVDKYKNISLIALP